MENFLVSLVLGVIAFGIFQTWRNYMNVRRRYHAYCMYALHYNKVEPADFEDFCRYEHINGRFTGPVWAAGFDIDRGAIK